MPTKLYLSVTNEFGTVIKQMEITKELYNIHFVKQQMELYRMNIQNEIKDEYYEMRDENIANFLILFQFYELLFMALEEI